MEIGIICMYRGGAVSFKEKRGYLNVILEFFAGVEDMQDVQC